MVKKWIGRHRLNHAIQIACTTCSTDRDRAPVSVEQTLKPFLVIHTEPLPQRNRPKRHSNCLPEMTECCRDELYINFRDIGWSDWILHPSGYHAYFCRGSCSTATSLTISGSQYNNVIMVSVIWFLRFYDVQYDVPIDNNYFDPIPDKKDLRKIFFSEQY